MARRSKTEASTRQLTSQQVAFAVNALEDTTIREAVPRVDYPGQQMPQAVRLRIPELMDRLGLTERVLIEKHLAPLLSATITKYFQDEGGVKQKREVADNYARLKALDIAFKLRKSYTAPDPKLNPDRPTVIVVDIPRPGHPRVEKPTDNAMNKGHSTTG